MLSYKKRTNITYKNTHIYVRIKINSPAKILPQKIFAVDLCEAEETDAILMYR